MSNTLLMPKATAVWLVENTALTFLQIADFCNLHHLEVKGIADGDVAQGIKGMDPVSSGQLTRDEIQLAQDDPDHALKLSEPKIEIPVVKTKRGPRYTPLSRRQDRPDAISWLLRYHPELTTGQVGKLVGTTKPTIEAIRDRSHWNSANIKPVDPVTLGLCKQSELDEAVQKAALRVEREQKALAKDSEKSGTLLPMTETLGKGAAPEVAPIVPAPTPDAPKHADIIKPPVEPEEKELDIDSVFAKLKELGSNKDDETSD